MTRACLFVGSLLVIALPSAPASAWGSGARGRSAAANRRQHRKPHWLHITGRAGLTENWRGHAELPQETCGSDIYDWSDVGSGQVNVDLRVTASGRVINRSTSGINESYEYRHTNVDCDGSRTTDTSTGHWSGSASGNRAVELPDRASVRLVRFIVHMPGTGGGTNTCSGTSPSSEFDFGDTFEYPWRGRHFHHFERWPALGDWNCLWIDVPDGTAPDVRNRAVETASLTATRG